MCRPYLPQPLLHVLYPDIGAEAEYAEILERPVFALPALFAVQCAAFALIGCEACQPFAVVGHSVGEFVAAVIAGTLELASAIELVCERSAAMEATLGARRSHGSIISLKASAVAAQMAIVRAEQEPHVNVAVFNSEEQCGISGENRALAAVVRALPPGTRTKRVRTTHADHSPSMASVAERVGRRAAAVYTSHPPEAPWCHWMSSVTGRALTPDEARDPEHWARHALQPVRFSDALRCAVNSAIAHRQTKEGDAAAIILVDLGDGMLERLAQTCMAESLPAHEQRSVRFCSLLPGKDAADDARMQADEVDAIVRGMMDPLRAAKMQRFLSTAVE